MEKVQTKNHMQLCIIFPVFCVALKPIDPQRLKILTFNKYIKYPYLGSLCHHHYSMQDMGKNEKSFITL